MAEITFIKVVSAGPGYTKVLASDGNTYTFEGDRNWRNNNPGNIEYGNFAKSQGAIGTDGRFAVFPSVETGLAAQESLQFEGKSYRDKTIAQAISRYAPEFENNTAAYAAQVAAAAGVPLTAKMSDLTPSQRQAFLAAQRKVEGFKVGTIRNDTGGTVDPAVVRKFGAVPRPGADIPGSSVASFQQQLAQRGFDPGPIDGINGPRTKAAVKAFQEANGLKVDGIVGPKTRAALETATASLPQGRTGKGASLQPTGSTFRPLPAPAPLTAPAALKAQPNNRADQRAEQALLRARKPANNNAITIPTGGIGNFLGGIGAGIQNIGSTVGSNLTKIGNTAKTAVADTVQAGANYLIPEMLGSVQGRTTLLTPYLQKAFTDKPGKAGTPNRYGNTPEERQANAARRQALQEGKAVPKAAVASSVSVTPPARSVRSPAVQPTVSAQSFTGSATGRTYVVGQTYQSSRGPMVATPDGKFIPAGTSAPSRPANQNVSPAPAVTSGQSWQNNPNEQRTDRFAGALDNFGMII